MLVRRVSWKEVSWGEEGGKLLRRVAQKQESRRKIGTGMRQDYYQYLTASVERKTNPSLAVTYIYNIPGTYFILIQFHATYKTYKTPEFF